MKRHLQCAEQQLSLSNLTKYCTCHTKWLSWLIRVTDITSFTMRGATYVILQHHQILRLPRKMTVMTAPRHRWNVIYNARNNRCHPPTSPNTAPATQNDCHDCSSSHMKRRLQCAEQHMSSSNITKYCAYHAKWLSNISQKFLENTWNVISNAGPIWELSEHDPSMKPSSATRLTNEVTFHAKHDHLVLKNTTFRAPAIILNFTEYCACHAKWHLNLTKCCTCHAKWLSWLLLVTHETSFTMRRATYVILQHHQILRLPRKMTVMTDPRHRWNVIDNARNNRRHPPTSPNTAPATQNDCHDWSSSHMKRRLQCAEQHMSSSNITKYCAYHAKWLSNISQKFLENTWNVISNAGPIREWSENDPTMIRAWSEHETVIRNPPHKRGYFSRQARPFCIEKYNISRSGYHSKFHRILRLPCKMTLEPHQMLHLPRKVTLQLHQVLHLPRKVTLLNFTKCCTCHEKWHLYL